MEKAQEIMKTLESTMKKYHANKTKVSEADLAGKYKVSFQKLKCQLKAEASAYLAAYCLSDFPILKSDSGKLAAAVERSIRENQVPKRAGRAVFRNFSLQELQEIAMEQRQRIQELYAAYFKQHICLYITESSLNPDDPHPPLIYNDLTGEFWSDESGGWTSLDKMPGGCGVGIIS